MTATTRFLFRGGHVWNGREDGRMPCDVLVEHGLIAAVAPRGTLPITDVTIIEGGTVRP